MLLYGYDCEDCGPFERWGNLATAVDPQTCPTCGRLAERSIASPHVRCGRAVTRYKAEAHNERSANEPKVVQHVGGFGQHGDRDGHQHHKHEHGRKQGRRSRRPWMVGH
jgi:putative FmdB family regulatory protein